MTDAPSIVPARSADDLWDVTRLFSGYAATLPIDLGYQDFAGELAALPGKYAPPRGEILIARDAQGMALGCVALRPLGETDCGEMKRLFVIEDARGLGLGRALAQAIIAEARAMGYRELRLDSLPSMTAAIRLYEELGFVPVAPYYAPTPDGTLFMALQL